MNVAMAWPNMWLSGSTFRNRIGKNGVPYRRYFWISRWTGAMLATTFRCVSTTPFGSAVAPDVNTISTISEGVMSGLARPDPAASGSGVHRIVVMRQTGGSSDAGS